MNFQEHLRKVGFLVSKKFKSKNTHPRFRTFGRKIRCVLIFQAIYIYRNKFNGAFLRPPIPRHLSGPVMKSKAQAVKYVDDGAVAVSIDLKQCLVEPQ